LHPAGHNQIVGRALERIAHGRGTRRPAVGAGQLKNALDHFRPNERTGGVMDGDELGRDIELLETATDRVLSARATGDNGNHFLKALHFDNLFIFGEPLRPTDDDDAGDRLGLLKGGDGMRDHWTSVDWGEELVETHPLAAAAGDYDRGEHASC